MSEMNITKLPKYAQEEIISLRREVARLIEELTAQQQDTPSRIAWGRSWRKHGARGYLPDDEEVSYVIATKPDSHIRIRLTEDGLYVTGDNSLQIRCEASNCFTVQERPR